MKKYLIAATVATMIAPAAHAATVSAGTQTTGNLFDSSELLSLAKFDTSMGILTGVTFFLEGGIQGTIRRDDTTDDAIGSILSTFTTTLVDGTNIEVNPESGPGVATGSLTPRVTWGRGTDLDSISFSGDLSFFEGSAGDTFNFLVSAGAITSDTDGINVAEIEGQADAGALVSYEFDEAITPIPLPAAAWMLLAGLGSLFAFRRFGKA